MKLQLLPIKSNDWNATALGDTEVDEVDKQWLLRTYHRIGRSFGSTIRVDSDGSWYVKPDSQQ